MDGCNGISRLVVVFFTHKLRVLSLQLDNKPLYNTKIQQSCRQLAMPLLEYQLE